MKHLMWPPHVVSSVDSTQAEAKRLAALGALPGTVALAETQTAGRGRLGRNWESPWGNLYLTLWLRPSLALAEWPQLTMIAALAIAGSLDALGVRAVALKWPNDVLIAGRKVAGILAEAQGADLFLGCGVNVNAPLPAEWTQATSLVQALGTEVERTTLLRMLLERFDAHYDALLRGRRFTHEWAQRLATLGRAVDISSVGRLVHGVAEQVTDDGALVVRRSDGVLEHFRAGDVTLRTTRIPEAAL